MYTAVSVVPHEEKKLWNQLNLYTSLGIQTYVPKANVDDYDSKLPQLDQVSYLHIPFLGDRYK